MKHQKNTEFRKRSRGSLLIISLFLSLILLIMGMAFLSMKVLQYQSSSLTGYSSQAVALAEAGMNDAKAKLEKDPGFPPFNDKNQTAFSYSENLYDVDETTKLGAFDVAIDSSQKGTPYFIIKVASCGTLLSSEGKILARRKLSAELDVSQKLRDNASLDNPNFYRFINWQDSGSL